MFDSGDDDQMQMVLDSSVQLAESKENNPKVQSTV